MKGNYASATRREAAAWRWKSQGGIKNVHMLKERHVDVALQRAEQLDGS